MTGWSPEFIIKSPLQSWGDITPQTRTEEQMPGGCLGPCSCSEQGNADPGETKVGR